MKNLAFDFNNMFSFSIGAEHGVTLKELAGRSALIEKAHRHFQGLINNSVNRVNLGLGWVSLPFQGSGLLGKIQKIGDEIAGQYENVISLGIGGSYLGLKAAQDALLPAYYNEFSALRKRRPKIYFEGNNLDPDTLSVLLSNLNPKKTFIIVISKSGETTETKAAFAVIGPWLKKACGLRYGRQVLAITDQRSGTLRKKVIQEQAKDILSFRDLPVLEGVGGRFSEFNVGLLHMAIAGINLKEVLSGAQAMQKRCSAENVFKNPAYMYGSLQEILYRKKGKCIAVVMPFSEGLKSTADWYVQLLAESLGKKYARKIEVISDGKEVWKKDLRKILNIGRTPLSSRGTGDLHSIQQNNVEGENNKSVTFIRIEKFRSDLKIGKEGDFLNGKTYSELMSLAEEATEWALVRESRPNCTIIMPEISPFHWGELLFFFEMATAFEGELLNVNAFDQPGVEGYKKYMYYKLKKPGISKEIADNINSHPLFKKSKFIL